MTKYIMTKADPSSSLKAKDVVEFKEAERDDKRVTILVLKSNTVITGVTQSILRDCLQEIPDSIEDAIQKIRNIYIGLQDGGVIFDYLGFGGDSNIKEKGEWNIEDCKCDFSEELWRYRIHDDYRELKDFFTEYGYIYLSDGTRWYRTLNPSWKLPIEFYSMKDIYAHLRKLQNEGVLLEVVDEFGEWGLYQKTGFDLPIEKYRVFDKFREQKEAYERDKDVQFWNKYIGMWVTLVFDPCWTSTIEYRVKPDSILSA